MVMCDKASSSDSGISSSSPHSLQSSASVLLSAPHSLQIIGSSENIFYQSSLFDNICFHVFTQRFGNFHTAVRTLIVFQYRRYCPPDRHAAAVERMHKLGLL